MKHITKKRWYEYAGMDCYAYTAECSCGYKAQGWTAEESEKEMMKHRLIEEFGLEPKDVEENLFEIADAVNSKIMGFHINEDKQNGN